MRRLEKKIDALLETFETRNTVSDNKDQAIQEVKEIIERLEQTLGQLDHAGIEQRKEVTQELRELRAGLLGLRSGTQPAPCQYTGTPIWLWVVSIAILILILLK